MKKAIIGLVLVSLASFVIVSCGGSTGGGGSNISVLGVTSGSPYVWVMENGSINFANIATPISGTAITDATVTLTNETQGTSLNLPHSTIPGRYASTAGGAFSAAGDKLALEIETTDATITGSPTEVPNPSYTNGSPAFGATRPFTLSWEVGYQGSTTHEATHTYILIVNSSGQGYQRVIPISQTSVTITSAEVATAGSYWLSITGVNSMPLTGAKDGSVVYVSGSNISWVELNYLIN